MRLQNIEVSAGEKKSGYLKVPGTPYEIPVTVICGVEDGETALITAGIHNAEYVGIQAAIELQNELQPENIRGTLVIVPLVNVSGFQKRTMSVVWEDNKNLNREFPGDANGSMASRFCYMIEKDLLSIANYYIDLHSGDGYEKLDSYAYYVGAVEPAVRETAFEMACRVSMDCLVESQGLSGGAYNYASSLGIPSILLERGGCGLWNSHEVDQDKADVRRILAYLHILKDADGSHPEEKHLIFRDAVYENAPIYGCWYPFFHTGDFFKEGELLGEIRDYFGNTLHQCYAKADGMILYQTGSLSVVQDGPMVAYGVMPEERHQYCGGREGHTHQHE
ncbi:MAG: M14 family metallopeptidase [Lachnospiraceae bacterium]|nr:M14 family metallopeptidase [Lachnospiraceae bacterium]